MNTDRIDAILQYALLVAGEEDGAMDRQLGPVHLIKYVYLADLAYAREHVGETYTGVEWKFYKFGPWSQSVHQRIEPALLAIHADKKHFPSAYGDKDEWVRWMASDDMFLRGLERKLPTVVVSSVRRHVHAFGQATPELLAYVYNTKPMRQAAPNEFLNFQCTVEHSQHDCPAMQDDRKLLSKKQQVNLKKKMAALREKSLEKFADKKKQQLVNPLISPRYDDVYLEGLEWLDSLAGVSMTMGEQDVFFTDSIWKSPSRTDDDFPR